MDDTDAGQAPVLRIVRGQPDDVEIAALAAATATLSAPDGSAESDRSGRSVWADRSAMLRYPGGRRPLRTGPGAWWASALPR